MDWSFVEEHLYKQMGSQITCVLHSALAINRMPFSDETFTADKNNHESGAVMMS